jgi:hypothetical protein
LSLSFAATVSGAIGAAVWPEHAQECLISVFPSVRP